MLRPEWKAGSSTCKTEGRSQKDEEAGAELPNRLPATSDESDDPAPFHCIHDKDDDVEDLDFEELHESIGDEMVENADIRRTSPRRGIKQAI